MFRVRAALICLAVTVTAGFAPAQSRFAPTPSPLVVEILPGVDDPNLIAELKLSDDQVKKLVARRQELWDLAYGLSLREFREKAKDRTEATDELLKKTLSADQYKRAVQLAAQSVLSGTNPFLRRHLPNVTRPEANLFLRYPELVTVFKLDDDQKASLTKSGGGWGGSQTIAMNASQTAAAREFLGKPMAQLWELKTDPRQDEVVTLPWSVHLLRAKDVGAAMNFTAEQKEELNEFFGQWDTLIRSRFSLSRKEAHAKAAELNAETDKVFTKVLKPEQNSRLKQIILQQVLSDTHIEWAHTHKETATALALTEKQTKEISTAWQEYRAAVRKAFEAGQTHSATEKAIKELIAVRRGKIEAIVTREQIAKFKELIGEPFTGSTQPAPPADLVGDPEIMMQSTERILGMQFGKYEDEFKQLAGNRSIQDELKLTEEQVKKATEIRTAIETEYRQSPRGSGGLEAAATKRSEATQAALEKLLTAEQAKRFRQLMLQQKEREKPSSMGGRTFNIPSAIAYPGVAEEVKLTEEQKKQLLRGTAPAKVLSDEQKTAITKMLGEPFKGTFKLPLAESTTPAGVRLSTLNGGMEKFAELLKLDAEQVKKLTAALDEYTVTAQGVPVGLSGFRGDQAEQYKTLKAAVEAYEKAVAAVLTAEQKKRLPQLVLQLEAARDLFETLTTPEVANTLDLSREQTLKLIELAADADRLQELLGQQNVDNAEGKLARHLRDSADDRLLAVLTEGQKKKWQESIGEAWPGLTKRVPVQRIRDDHVGDTWGPRRRNIVP